MPTSGADRASPARVRWSRGTISIAISLGLVLYGLAAPFSAAPMERFGVRRGMLVALAAIAASASVLLASCLSLRIGQQERRLAAGEALPAAT